MKSFKQLQEVLKKSDDISTWISDFVKSDDPKFAGKSKKERIKMAQGAYYGAQKENISIDEADKKEDLPFEPDAPKKNPSAKAGKYGLGYSVAKHLARQAMKKLTKEEVEQIDEISKDTLRSYADKAFQHGNDLHYDIAHERDKDEKAKMKAKLSKRNDGVIKASQKLNKENAVLTFDDFLKEQIDELSVKTMKSAEQGLKDKALDARMDDNKAGMRHYLGRALKVGAKADAKERAEKRAMKNEEIEQIDELDKKTLGSYVNKAHDQLMKHTASVNMKYGRGDKDATAYALDKDALRKTANRTQGMKTAVNKLTKEETEPMLTFKELMENISEGKIDDLKDKIAARKATQSAYDKDYKPAAKSNVQKVKGHSYGAGEEEGEDDDDNTKKLSKPAKPEVKRGRGRPAGSKSGARN